MLNITAPNYTYCPFCGRALTTFQEEGKTRKRCEYDKWTYYPFVASAVAGVIVRDGKTLLVKRAREPYKDTWMFPAGFVDYGESPIDTLHREITEETGLKIQNETFIDVIQITDDPRQPGHWCFFYKVNITDGELLTDTEENQDIQWFDLQELPIIGWESHKKIAKKLQEGKI